MINQPAIPSIIGIYEIANTPDVHLIELFLDIPPSEVNVSTFTQKDDSLPEDCWQVAYDEHYLCKDGVTVIGRFGDQFSLSKEFTTRIAFFLYFLNFDKPLTTQFGEIALSSPKPMPERLSGIIEFSN